MGYKDNDEITLLAGIAAAIQGIVPPNELDRLKGEIRAIEQMTALSADGVVQITFIGRPNVGKSAIISSVVIDNPPAEKRDYVNAMRDEVFAEIGGITAKLTEVSGVVSGGEDSRHRDSIM